MKVTTHISIIVLMCIIGIVKGFSQNVPFCTAQYIAESFMGVSQTTKGQMASIQFKSSREEQPTMYIFSLPYRWVIIAGDYRVQPILAYSNIDAGEFPKDDMPPGLSYMLECYDAQVHYLRNHREIVEVNSMWEIYMEEDRSLENNSSVIVPPLLARNGLENIWNQSGNNSGSDTAKAYNKYCPPLPDCEHALVGCVALSMSQIMWYWKWPYAAIVNDALSNQISRYYDWDLMPYRITDSSNLEKVNMIANLLHDVGVSVNMDYGCSSSGAFPSDIASALQNIFGFHSSNLLSRTNYSDTQWITMIKEELDASHPVLYGGASTSGGRHRFVIDGYDSGNLFHVNYGWGGSANGYYTLSSMIYPNGQSMVMNIYPNYPSCNSIIISATDIWATNFNVQNGGEITIGDRTIINGMNGVILSGESVKLTAGFKIEAGARVYIDVKDMHCNDERGISNILGSEEASNITHVPLKKNFKNIPIAEKVFQNGHFRIQIGDKEYNATGERIK